ncbi:MAG TPA: MBG domain-containing protein [Candidatus Bathyarchaeia archaeon]|nr:MBG domain-containing protein [Candidatus Bathyarchaeia archaeon]
MTRKSLLGLWCVLLLTFITAFSLISYARTAPNPAVQQGPDYLVPTPRITQAIDLRNYVTLHGNTRPEAANAVGYRGPAEAVLPMEHMLLFLQRSPEQEQALDQYIDSLNDRNSPNFHKWLTPEELGKSYGVADEDIQQVTNWLESEGFVVNRVYENKMVLDISGTAGAVQQAFHTEIGKLVVNGEEHIANMSDPQIPAALAPVIKGFASLNDFKPRAHHISAADYTFAGCTSSSARPTEPGTCYAITPQDNAVIYNLNPLWTAGYSGQGQTIALVEDTDVYNFPGDWNTYRSTFGLSGYAGTFTQVHPGGCTDPGTNADDGEAAIDVEVASGIAPSAAIELIACPSGTVTFGGQIALQNLINAAGPYPGVVSVSYGVCEAFNGNGGNASFYNTYQQAAAQGISVFTSSGDEGSSECSRNLTNGASYDQTSLGVSGWGGTPFDVSVGGTDFEDAYNAKTGQNGGNPLSTYWNSTNSSSYGSAKSYIPEIPWNDACASVLIAFDARSSYNTYGASGTGMCNTSPFNTASGYLIAAAGTGGASNCAIGAGGTNTSSAGVTQPQCQGYSKPSYQTGSMLTGGQAVYGMPSDGLRDVPDVSMFAANGLFGHFETVCWSDPSQTSGGAASCSGAPSTWSGFGGTSVSSPTMAAIQALVNQKTGQTWGNPLQYYYQAGQNEYGVVGGTFQGSGCNSSTGSGSGCVFNDVTQGDIDNACRYNGTVVEHHCYKPSTNGVDSTDNVTGATVINGGTGYTSAPTCTIAGPTNANPYKSPQGTTLWAGGTQAACTASFNAGTTNAVWTVAMLSTSGVGYQILLTNPAGTTTCGPYTLSGASTTAMATNLNTAIGTGCSLATSTVSSSTVTITARNAGYAGDFNTQFGANGTIFQAAYVTITNTTLGQGPGYVSGITITTAGTGYAPETPITLTGGGGSGAIAVANTTIATASQSYQPAYGANPGYDLATGLGTPNAYNLVNSSVWGPVQQPCPITFPNPGPLTYSANQTTLAATDPACNLPITYVVNSGPGTVNGNQLTTTGAGTIVVTASQPGNSNYLSSSQQISIVVNQATLTVTANPASDTYGGPIPSLTYTITGFVGSDNQGNSTTGAPSESTTAITSSNVGTYPINISQGTLASTNYNFTFVNGVFTVGQATLTVTAGNTAITYGCGCSPVLTYAITGFVLGQNQGTATTGAPNETTTGTQGAAGTYPITISQGTLLANNNNYTFTFVNGTLTVQQAPLTVTANNMTIVAYTNLPTFTASYSGFVNGDNQGSLTGAPAFSTDAPQDPPEGSYTITVTQGTLADPNYSFTFVNGTLTVTAATAQLTAPPKNTMLSGSSVTFTWSQESNAVSYMLNLGSMPGGSDLASVTTSNLTTQVNGLPTDGSYIYATLLGSTDGTSYTQQDTALYVANSPIAVIISPLPNTTFNGSTVTFTWVPGSQSTAYWLDIGSAPGGNNYEQSGNLGTATTLTVNNLPTDGSAVYVTLWSYLNGSWTYNEYQYTAYSSASQIATMQSPTPGSTLSGSSQLFTWNAGTQSTAYWIDAGSTRGGNQYFQSGNLGGALQETVTGLPTDGSTVYITLWSLLNGQWVYNEYTYTAYSVSSGAGQMTSPVPGSTLPGPTVTFNWSAGSQSTAYWLDLGSTPGGNQYFQSGNLGNVLQVTVNGLPTDGSTVYATLYSLIGGQWVANSYTYTAFSLSNGLAVMQSPQNDTEVDGTQVTFTWSAGTNASGYWLDIGSTVGGNDIYQSGNLGLALTTTVYDMPNDGSEVYATLYTLINGQWYYNQYMYESGAGGPTGPAKKPAGMKPLNRR